MKVLDFSADNDMEKDSNGEYTSATLNAGALPESFTICMAIIVDAWTTEFKGAKLFILLDVNGEQWGYVRIFAASSYTEYMVYLGPFDPHIKQIETIFFPLQWTRACLSLDSSKVVVVVDGEMVVQMEYRREEDLARPTNLSLLLAVDPFGYEVPVKIANLNVFSSSSPVERMVGLTTAGGEECGAPGDFLNWEEAEWTLRSQAKMIEVEMSWIEGPCRMRESEVQVFTANFKEHQECMQHCKKIVDGRSPAVTTEEEWENFKLEVDLITEDRYSLPYMWLSATKGDKDGKLAKLDHWPEAIVVNNETQKAIWRDFYSGQRLDNWAKPYYEIREDDYTNNCIAAYTDVPWDRSWFQWLCTSYDFSCPCSYPTQPLLRLRGRCSSLIDNLFTPRHLPDTPGNMILLGQFTTRIEYNEKSSQWMLTDAKSDVTAVSRATKLSYVLGKQEWTISNDVYECGKGKSYTTMLKLTGCKEEGEFTCNDGQCIKMEERCNQVPDCRDKSDEVGWDKF